MVQVINFIAKPGTDPVIPLACCSRLRRSCALPQVNVNYAFKQLSRGGRVLHDPKSLLKVKKEMEWQCKVFLKRVCKVNV